MPNFRHTRDAVPKRGDVAAFAARLYSSVIHGLTPTATCCRRSAALFDPPGWRPGGIHLRRGSDWDHPGARASRPHKAWHNGSEPRDGRFGALCGGVALDRRLLARIRMRAGRPRSRGGVPSRDDIDGRRGAPSGATHCQYAPEAFVALRAFSCQWASKMAGAERCPTEGAERPEWGSGPLDGRHTGARLSRPQKTWRNCRDPLKGGFRARCKGVPWLGGWLQE